MIQWAVLTCDREDESCEEEIEFIMGEALDVITYRWIRSQGWRVGFGAGPSYCPFHHAVTPGEQQPFPGALL